jgi:hypothetical protein
MEAGPIIESEIAAESAKAAALQRIISLSLFALSAMAYVASGDWRHATAAMAFLLSLLTTVLAAKWGAPLWSILQVIGVVALVLSDVPG